MANITLGGNPIETSGALPAIGSQAIDFELIKNQVNLTREKEFAGVSFFFYESLWNFDETPEIRKAEYKSLFPNPINR